MPNTAIPREDFMVALMEDEGWSEHMAGEERGMLLQALEKGLPDPVAEQDARRIRYGLRVLDEATGHLQGGSLTPALLAEAFLGGMLP